MLRAVPRAPAASTALRLGARALATRPAGPGGLFRARAAVSPAQLQRQAAKNRLHRARTAVEELRQHDAVTPTPTTTSGRGTAATASAATQTLQSPGAAANDPDARPDFETEADITSYVEARIEESMRAGAFDNLRNKGRPLGKQPRSATDYAMRMMRDAGVRPPWLQLMHDIDADVATLRRALVAARRRAVAAGDCAGDEGAARQRRRFARAVVAARHSVADINARVDRFNISRPVGFAHLFRLRLRVDDEARRAVRAVAAERAAERAAARGAAEPTRDCDAREAAPVGSCATARPDHAAEPAPPSHDAAPEPPDGPKAEEPRPAWQLFARFVRAADVREYDMVSWGRRRRDGDGSGNDPEADARRGEERGGGSGGGGGARGS